MSRAATSFSWRSTSSRNRFLAVLLLSAAAHAALVCLCIVSQEAVKQREIGSEYIMVNLLLTGQANKQDVDAESPQRGEEMLAEQKGVNTGSLPGSTVEEGTKSIDYSVSHKCAKDISEEVERDRTRRSLSLMESMVISKPGYQDNEYWDRVRRRIAAQLHYPWKCRTRKIGGRVVVRVFIGKDGRIIEAEVMSSHEYYLSEAVLRAVYRAAPFEPPPTKDAPVELQVPVVFRMGG